LTLRPLSARPLDGGPVTHAVKRTPVKAGELRCPTHRMRIILRAAARGTAWREPRERQMRRRPKASGIEHSYGRGRHDAPEVSSSPRKAGNQPLLFLPFTSCVSLLSATRLASLHTRSARQMRAGIEVAAQPPCWVRRYCNSDSNRVYRTVAAPSHADDAYFDFGCYS
jgi:hypothetical protein